MEREHGSTLADLVVTDPARLQWIFSTYDEGRERGRPGIIFSGKHTASDGITVLREESADEQAVN